MERLLVLRLEALGCEAEALLNGVPLARVGGGRPVLTLPVHEYTLSGTNEIELVVKPAAPAVIAAGVYAGTTLADDGSPILLLDVAGLAQAGHRGKRVGAPHIRVQGRSEAVQIDRIGLAQDVVFDADRGDVLEGGPPDRVRNLRTQGFLAARPQVISVSHLVEPSFCLAFHSRVHTCGKASPTRGTKGFPGTDLSPPAHRTPWGIPVAEGGP